MAPKAAPRSHPTGVKKIKRARKAHPKVLGSHITTDQKPSPLLSLPPEIRNIIWEYALTHTGELTYDHTNTGFRVPKTEDTYRPLGLTATCHQIALETQHLVFKLNTVLFLSYPRFCHFATKLLRKERAQGWRFQLKGLRVLQKGQMWTILPRHG